MSITIRYSATALFSSSLSPLTVEVTKIKRETCPIVRHGEKIKKLCLILSTFKVGDPVKIVNVAVRIFSP